MSGALLRVESACCRFGEREILKSASLHAVPGRTTVLLGRNGCGKTTLLRIAAGLLAADNGAVHFGKECWTRPRLAQLARRGLFMLPARELLPWGFSLRQLLAWGESAWGTGRTERAIETLRLDALLDAWPHEMSGGERRRAELGLVYQRAPLCLLADEPLGGVAPADAELVIATLRMIAAEGCAVVATGHEVASMLALADEVVWMVAGTTHALGSPAAALRHHQFRQEYLGPGMNVLNIE